MGTPTEDWSEFIPPGAEVVELAGKWKHGWIPLDATAVSSKMKGKTGGKKWWSGDGKAIGVPKRGGKQYKKPTGWKRTNELDKMDMPTRNKIGELNKAGKFREAQQEAIASRNHNKRKLAEVDKTRNKMLTVKQVSGAKTGRRPSTGPELPFKNPSSGSTAGKRDQRANNRLQTRDMSDKEFNDPNRTGERDFPNTDKPVPPKAFKVDKLTVTAGPVPGRGEIPGDRSGFLAAHGLGGYNQREAAKTARKMLAKKLGIPLSRLNDHGHFNYSDFTTGKFYYPKGDGSFGSYVSPHFKPKGGKPGKA